MIERWGTKIPSIVDFHLPMKGVVWHWTGGGPTCNSVDLRAYHYGVDHDGKVRVGVHKVQANIPPLRGSSYAQHTGGFNSWKIGIAGAGMMGYKSPRDPGVYPLNEKQITVMCELAGYFLWLFRLDPYDVRNALTHQEVWTRLGIKGVSNHQKTDIEFLAFKPELKPHEVGGYMRGLAARYILESLLPPEASKLPLLRVGARGRHVERLQSILGVNGPDIFGPLTLQAVLAFQARHKLVVDGVVGKNTWKVLLWSEISNKSHGGVIT